MIFYAHGSEDSLDNDVIYVFEKMPSFKECQEFCASKEENRNIITINNGIVSDCFKGTIDEINNGLYYTYLLHNQEHPLIIERKVERDILIKAIRVLRCLISHCSRTKYRKDIKKIIKSNSWKERVNLAKSIDYLNIDEYNKNGNLEDVLKIFAFQTSQFLGLYCDEEIYTKSYAAKKYPKLKKYLYREKNSNKEDLIVFINNCLEIFNNFNVKEKNGICYFTDFDKIVDLRKEIYV